MSKYVRTKDRVYEINPTLTDEQIDISLGKNTPRADAIEELCDEFVVIVDGKHYIRVPASNPNFQTYGAIWTEKGLIYVAKMNEKGELELL